MAVPSIDQFAKVLSQEPDWYCLGIYLGAPSDDLDLIKHEYRGLSVSRYLIETYKRLERLGKAPTWNSIASNLIEMGNCFLAEHIDSTYIQPSLEPPSFSSEPGSSNSEQSIPAVDQISKAPEMLVPPEISNQMKTSTTVPLQHESTPATDPQQLASDQQVIATPSDTTQQQLVVIEDERVYAVGSEFWPLFKRYVSLSFKIGRLFKASNIDVDDMQVLIEDLCGLLPLPQNEASIFAVFDRLKKHCSILNFQPLVCVVDELLSNEETLRKNLLELEKAMDCFKRSAKMTAVVNLIRSHYESIRDGDKKILKLKVQEFWENFNLNEFEIVITKILGRLYTKLSHIIVDAGCICVSWIIPPSVNYTKLLPELSLEFLQLIGVISLYIGDNVIYNVGEEGCQTLEAVMLQAIELKNTQAIELLLAVGCSPEVASYNGDHAITNVVNIKERSADDGSGGGVDHVCVLGHNEHIEAIVDTSRKPECADCKMKEKQIKQLHAQTHILQQKNKELLRKQKENGITLIML